MRLLKVGLVNTIENVIIPKLKGVIVYEHTNFNGASSAKGFGNWNMNEMGIANDSISSIKIEPGLEFIGYEHSDFQGEYIVIRGDNPNLHAIGWGDKISSFQIKPNIPFSAMFSK